MYRMMLLPGGSTSALAESESQSCSSYFEISARFCRELLLVFDDAIQTCWPVGAVGIHQQHYAVGQTRAVGQCEPVCVVDAELTFEGGHVIGGEPAVLTCPRATLNRAASST